MSRIFWDTNLFVYLFEDKGELTERVVTLRERMIERSDELFTSALALGEILVRPVEAADNSLARRYEQAILTAATVLPFDQGAALAFARVRQDRSIKPPDAIQLACASAAGVDLFITNDARLSRKVVPGIHFIQPLANAAL
ncbi:MAG: PIN domain-containing protein [Gammaproteobacteria bacterium]|nr:PIN domain-containing protein [Gammaproteobacteria bacterium]MCY4344088.1 PIN domain-containing protein [Gammaproteobacteria bacterium]